MNPFYAVLIACSPVALAVLCSFLDFFRITAFQCLVLVLYFVLFLSIVSATSQKGTKTDPALYVAGSTEHQGSPTARKAGLTAAAARPRWHSPMPINIAPKTAANPTNAKGNVRSPYVLPPRRPGPLKDTTNTTWQTAIPRSRPPPTASQVSDPCQKGTGSWSDGEVVVAVMGVTGAGKSSFIQNATGRKDILIGHGLEAVTTEVKCYRFSHRNTNYVLVDTPGFNDTRDSDEFITTRILEWLETSFRGGTRLNGIVYLHRIIDTRMQGSAVANLRMFRRLCGPDSFHNVVLATTFWQTVTRQTGEARERELCENKNFWARMVEKGSEVVRLGQDRHSALGVLMRFDKKQKITLQAQYEIVEQGQSVAQTANAELAALQRGMEADLRVERARAENQLCLQQIEIQMALWQEGRRLEQELQERKRREEREEAESLAALLQVQEREKEALRKEKLRIELEEAERKRRENKERTKEKAQARALLLQLLSQEAERKRSREQQEQDDALLAKMLQDDIQEHQHQMKEQQEARKRHYLSYRCQQTSVVNRSCNKCSRSLNKKGQFYYHCCHCRGPNDNRFGVDNYNQCGACGGCCPVAEHPYMTRRETRSECVIM